MGILMNKLRSYFRNSKYRSKLNVFFLLIGLIPLLVTSIFVIFRFYRILTDQAYESMEVSLHQACETINRQVDIYDNLLNYTVFDQSLQSVLEKPQTQKYETYKAYVETIDPVLTAPKFYHDSIVQMTIYSNNIQVEHDLTLAPLSKIEGEEWFSELEKTSETIWVWPDDTKNQLLAIRCFPGYRDTKAYLGMYCDLNFLKEALNSFQKEGAGICLVDSENQIIYTRTTNNSRSSVKDITEIENTYSYRKRDLDKVPLSVYIYTENSVIYEEFWHIMTVMATIIFLCLIAIIVFGRLISKHLVKRIEQLTVCVNQVDSGKMELDIQDDTQDEIGVLIRSFHKMLEQIQKLIREVYENKITHQKLEMKALQAQINPHFLYNTLSIINWKAIMAGEEDISTITLALSDYYRTTLNKGDTFISVSGEIRNIKSYLDIQLIMHDYGFEVEYQIAPTVEQYKMPKLILQPLVENSLEHGLDVKEDGDKKIWLICEESEEYLIWTVRDNGVGMDEDHIENLARTHVTGYGIKNINERLNLLYGEQSKLQVKSKVGEGTEIIIHIPKDGTSEERGVLDEK